MPQTTKNVYLTVLPVNPILPYECNSFKESNFQESKWKRNNLAKIYWKEFCSELSFGVSFI